MAILAQADQVCGPPKGLAQDYTTISQAGATIARGSRGPNHNAELCRRDSANDNAQGSSLVTSLGDGDAQCSQVRESIGHDFLPAREQHV